MTAIAIRPWFERPPDGAPLAGPATGAVWSGRALLRRRGVLMFALSLVVYLAGGAWLAFGVDTVMSDAASRVANAGYVLFSRDPHLAAVGFVWSPLPSLAQLPLLPVKYVWPEFVTSCFVGAVQSALFMAGAAYQLRRYFHELGLSRWLAVAATLLFALNPLIVFYGVNGMSEASFLFFLIAGTRYLSRWLVTERSVDLALSGSALGLAYLCRYEAAAAGVAAVVFVGLVTWWRAGRALPWGERRAATAANALLVALPFLFAFVGWAIASWLIVGSPFAQFTSEYGNSAQTALSSTYIDSIARPAGLIGLIKYLIEQWLALAPLGVAVAVVAALVAVRHRDLRPTAPVVVLGSSLAFAVVAFLGGQTFGWLRFLIGVVPLVVILAAGAAANLTRVPTPWRLCWPSSDRAVRIPRVLGAVAVVALVAVGVPRAGSALLDRRVGREEADYLTAVLRPDDVGDVRRAPGQRLEADRAVAEYLDSLDLPDGSVLVDSADGFGVILSSTRPRQFVITSDRDFGTVVGDPREFEVRYLLSRPNTFSAVDAVAEAVPGLFDGTSTVASLSRVFTSDRGDLTPWHLFQVTSP